MRISVKQLATGVLFFSIMLLAFWMDVPWWCFSLILGVDMFVCYWMLEEDTIQIRVPVITFLWSMGLGLAAFATGAVTGDSFSSQIEDKSLGRRARHLPEYSLTLLSFSICTGIMAVVGGMRNEPKVQTKPVARKKTLDMRSSSPACIDVRKFLSAAPYRDAHNLALWFLERKRHIRGESTDASHAAFAHLESCASCMVWFNSVVPAQVFTRQSRMVQYCCPSMFVATEEAEQRRTNRFSYSLFRGEDVCWQIDGKNTFARFCPWCGKILPTHPFVE
jgi:hypothetical protein